MANYKRPSEGFRYENGGVKLTVAPDAIPIGKYAALQNVRSVTQSGMRTRPGMVQLFTTGGLPVTDIRAYTTLGSDNLPRFLARSFNDKIYLDTGAQVGSLSGAPVLNEAPGVSMIPFRPNESPNPYMYIASPYDYQKFSAPNVSNAVTQQNVGIAEPQAPPDAGISQEITAYMGQPAGGAFTTAGNASSLSFGNRVTDTIQAAFPDPTNLGMTTLHVAGGGNLAAGVYIQGNVLAYLWPRLSNEQGAFLRAYPLSTSTALATASNNSLMFNPPQYNGTTDPNVQPMQWATLNGTGAITGYIPLPTAGGQVGNQLYDMVVLAQLFIPVPGNYTLNINHDDGIIFAIQGAKLVSGPFSDPFGSHTQTAVNGYSFSAGSSSVLGGTNQSGNRNETFVVNFPAAGAYSMEIDYSQWVNEQQLVVLSNGAIIFGASSISSYQRGMAITLNGGLARVQDVFAPLPQAIAIAGIFYFSGTSGACVVVPSQLGSGPGVDDTSIYAASWIASLRRGALVQIGTEVCFVLDVETGPNGTVCFTTTTVNTHTTSDMLKGVPAISVFGESTATGATVASTDVQFSTTTAGSAPYISTVSFPQNVNPFAVISAQPEDLIHVSINVDNLANLNEVKVLFDVGDGSFTQNFYYYAIRPNDIALGVSNGLTQLGVAQLVAQRAAIDEEKAAESNNQGPTASSAQSTIGTSQWSEVIFSINEMTRVGNDQSKTLQNLTAVQVLVNGSGVLNVAFNSILTTGGFSADTGQSGAPYLYRVRPRSSVTGAKGNPSPATRYGTSPRRQQVTVILPSAAYDTQIDTWDIERYGGTVTSWRRIGSTPVTNSQFLDNYSDYAALAGEALEFDNYQPWPSIDLPLVATATHVTGTTALVNIGASTQAVTSYLPGNIVQIGGANFYTLWTRPTYVSGTTYLFQFLENAGASSNSALNIYEPAIAQQRLPYMWGPDADGTVFACGDRLRPGTVYECKANAPDSAPDTYNQEITPPSEPLIGGEVMNGVSYVASTERWWRMYFQGAGPNRYSVVQQAIPRGLAAPYGKCTDGQSISFWAKDGIWDTKEGSLTDEDLYTLFPHEGVLGQSITYGPVTYVPPDYSRAGAFRLETGNGFLYATYQDTTSAWHTLVYDRKLKAWSLDKYGTSASVVYHAEQPSGTLLKQTSTVLYPSLLFGLTNGIVAKEQDATNDLSTPISGVIASPEWDAGDVRAGYSWGDLWLDCTPIAQVTATPMTFGQQVSPPVSVGPSASRIQTPISLGGELLSDFLGMMVTWTDDFSGQTSPTKFHIWQPSFIPKPETIDDRFTDWYSAGDDDTASPAAWWQGFILHADTFNAVKGLAVRDADSGATHAFTPTVQHNGEQSKAYSFNTPFIAHLVRIEPTDSVPWRMFDVEFVSQPTPEMAETWQTQGTAFGFNGYSHIQRIVAAYAATAPITLTITSFDGTSPTPITLPSTGGAYQKLLVVLTANKGQLYFFKASSATPFQFYMNDWEILIGNWGRTNIYLTYKSLGGKRGDTAAI